MKNILTREKLIETQHAFDCEIWVNNIQEILDSTNENDILIQDKYLDLIKDKASWKQIKYCKALNLDLKMNLPKEAIGWILEKIKSCEIEKIRDCTYYKGNKKNVFGLFGLDSETKEFWFNYDEIEPVLKNKYFLKYNEIYELMNKILEEYLKIKDYKTISYNTYLRNTYKLVYEKHINKK